MNSQRPVEEKESKHPSWQITENDFHLEKSSGLLFKKTSPAFPNIKWVELTNEYICGVPSITLNVYITHAQSEQFIKMVQSLSSAKEILGVDIKNKCFRIKINNREDLVTALKALEDVDPSLSEIEKEIRYAYDPKYFLRRDRVTAFLLGLNDRVGQESDLNKVWGKSSIAEKNLFGMIFSFDQAIPQRSNQGVVDMLLETDQDNGKATHHKKK